MARVRQLPGCVALACVVLVTGCSSQSAKTADAKATRASTTSTSVAASTTSTPAAATGDTVTTTTTPVGAPTTQATRPATVAPTALPATTLPRVDNTLANQRCKSYAQSTLNSTLNQIAGDKASLDAQLSDLARRGLLTSGMADDVRTQLAQIAPRTDAAYADYDASLDACDATYPI